MAMSVYAAWRHRATCCIDFTRSRAQRVTQLDYFAVTDTNVAVKNVRGGDDMRIAHDEIEVSQGC